MQIKCGSCGKVYDYGKDETCPKCGAFNQPPNRRAGRPETPSGRAAPAPGREPANVKRPSAARVAAGGLPQMRAAKRCLTLFLAVLAIFITGTVAYFGSRENRRQEEARAAAAKTAQEAGRRAELAARAASQNEAAARAAWEEMESAPPAPEMPSAPEFPGVPWEIAPPSAPALSEPAPFEPAPSEAPAPPARRSVAELASFTYEDLEVGQCQGVSLRVNATGPLDSPEVRELLMRGEKAIFIDFTATVVDTGLFERDFFQTPFVRVGQDGGRSLWLYNVGLGEPFQELDVDGMRYTERTTTSGQLFFAVPEDCDTFMLHFGDPDSSYYIQRLNV